uniref:Uncharacterized protein n=1 Tax=Anopheles dirus TaxID=7168 RepID=A0A182NXC3_9DIPT
MMPHILSILLNSGDLQTVPSIVRRIAHFNINPKRSEKDAQISVKQALQRAIEIGIVRENNKRNAYGLTNKWFTPETQRFHAQLHEVVQSMHLDFNDSTVETQASGQQMECMGPGMGQRRSPAQIRAIAIYRRMREQREREEREAAARAKERRNSKSRSRSRTRRASSGTRSRSKRRSSTRSRSRS